MKNKTWRYWVVASIVLLLVGCGGGAKKQTNEEVSMDSTTMACDGLKTLQLDGVKVTWIQDNAKERLMERTLFADASDELIDSLKLADGIPSSMSTFLVAQVVKTMNAYKDRLHLFEFGETLPGNVVTMNAEGHTPGHTVYQAGKLLVIADLIHGAALQLEHPEICASYDMDKDAAVKSRKHFLRYAKENGLTMAGMHLPPPGFK